jgi:hypothetical protein
LAGFRTPLGGGKQQQATRNVALNATIGFRFGTDGFVVDFGPEGVLPRPARALRRTKVPFLKKSSWQAGREKTPCFRLRPTLCLTGVSAPKMVL